MAMYKIIGADQKIYGPVSTEEMQRWLQEGRANAESRVQVDDNPEWQPVAAVPELAAFLAALAAAPQPFSPVPQPLSPPRNNRMAVAGFVCSLVGLLCCATGLPSILGLVFSIMGLGQIRKDPRQEGRGLAIAGIIISSLGLIAMAIFWISVINGAFSNFD